MKSAILFLPIFLLPIPTPAEEASSAAPAKPEPTYTVAFQGGFTNTFQLVLGGYFGKGADFQNRATVSVNNLWRTGDSLSVFGWSTTDLPTSTPNWQAGILYKSRLLKTKSHTLSATGGLQRWDLPSVKTGTQDWHITGNVTYTANLNWAPITVSGDSWSALRSTLGTGSAMYLQLNTLHPLLRRESFQFGFRHGPAYSYSWLLYGAKGNRVFRYSGSLVAAWKNTTIEGGFRQQFGLQDSIPRYRYWSILATHQFSGPLKRHR